MHLFQKHDCIVTHPQSTQTSFSAHAPNPRHVCTGASTNQKIHPLPFKQRTTHTQVMTQHIPCLPPPPAHPPCAVVHELVKTSTGRVASAILHTHTPITTTTTTTTPAHPTPPRPLCSTSTAGRAVVHVSVCGSSHCKAPASQSTHYKHPPQPQQAPLCSATATLLPGCGACLHAREKPLA